MGLQVPSVAASLGYEAMESAFLFENLVAAPQGVYTMPDVKKNRRYVYS